MPAAHTAGVTRGRLRAADLDSPFYGVRRIRAAAAESDDAPFARDRAQQDAVAALARAYAHIMPSDAFFAGRTGLALRALPIVHGDDLDVGVYAPGRAVRRRGIRGRVIDRALVHVEKISGLRVATAASCWAMLASELTVRDLIVIGDAIVHVPRDRTGTRRPERALASPAQLARAADAGPRRGSRRLREALAAVRVESASPLETEFRLDIAAAGLPEPHLDQEIFDAGGRRLGISEFAYPECRTVVEIEGDHHRRDRAQWARDLQKYADYADAGWEVVRLSARDVRGRTGVERLARALTRRAPLGPS